MEAYHTKLAYDMRMAELETAGRGAVITVSASANASADVSASQTVRCLDACELSRSELLELKGAIKSLEDAKRPDSACDKAARVLDLAKKSADAAKTVAPFVSSILSMLCGK